MLSVFPGDEVCCPIGSKLSAWLTTYRMMMSDYEVTLINDNSQYTSQLGLPHSLLQELC